MSATLPVACECEHVHHFTDTALFRTDAHAYFAEVAGARGPTTVPFMSRAAMCDWCLTHCHPGARRV